MYKKWPLNCCYHTHVDYTGALDLNLRAISSPFLNLIDWRLAAWSMHTIIPKRAPNKILILSLLKMWTFYWYIIYGTLLLQLLRSSQHSQFILFSRKLSILINNLKLCLPSTANPDLCFYESFWVTFLGSHFGWLLF